MAVDIFEMIKKTIIIQDMWYNDFVQRRKEDLFI